jgi:hypothetical protein
MVFRENVYPYFFSTRGEQTPRQTGRLLWCRAITDKADKACERECSTGWSRQKGQGDPACGWEICEWEVSGHTKQQEPFWEILSPRILCWCSEGQTDVEVWCWVPVGWSDFPNIKYDKWQPITNLPGSEHMIVLQDFPRLSHMVRQYLTVKQTPWTQLERQQEEWHTHTHTLAEKYTHLPLCHRHTLVIVTDTHQHIDRGLYTYMNSYLTQAYRLSIIIDKSTLLSIVDW